MRHLGVPCVLLTAALGALLYVGYNLADPCINPVVTEKFYLPFVTDHQSDGTTKTVSEMWVISVDGIGHIRCTKETWNHVNVGDTVEPMETDRDDGRKMLRLRQDYGVEFPVYVTPEKQ